MESCMAGILGDPMAKAVKAADRLHNVICAIVCDEAFKCRYIRESEAWFLDPDPRIPQAVERLKKCYRNKGKRHRKVPFF